MLYAQCCSAKSAAHASRTTADVRNPLRNHMDFLEVSVLPSMTVRFRQTNPQALYAMKLIWSPGKRSTMDSMSSASRMEMEMARQKCLYPSGDQASIHVMVAVFIGGCIL